MLRQLWLSAKHWLERAPVSDPVDRRNAVVMQLVLLFIGLMLPINWAYHLLVVGMSKWRGRDLLLAADMATAVAALVAFFLIRTGRFRLAIQLFLAVMLLGLLADSTAIGFTTLMFDQTFIVLSLVVGGLVLGRRALWVILAMLLATFIFAMLVDAQALVSEGKPSAAAFGNLPSTMISYLLITIVIDRCVNALRESLDESNERGRRLQREMVERERAQAQLLHAQKLEAVGRVASGVAHDFDNVIGVILGFSTQRERLADKGQRALVDALEGVELAARRAAAVSRKLLTFSRNDVAAPQTFDAAEALRELVPMLRQLFGATTRLHLHADMGVALPVRMDRGQFELMLLNIAANARDAMPAESGVFEIEAYREDMASCVLITLRDNGSGMSEQVRARVFEPFYTTKPPGAGTGLGLGVVYDLVTGAGGSIVVDSAPGQGASFSIRLPLAAG
ncbi:sensor histidine kinase [Dyella koreensis]|uniref:histidine kinase n=1 Tax=Dyella koreensis TaxID=311235 RepID=A0ABW8K2J6_9GAMM